MLLILFHIELNARFTAECQFRERFQENSYNTYASAVHRGQRSGRQWYVALNKRGKAKRGCSPRARPQHVSTHFLPLEELLSELIGTKQCLNNEKKSHTAASMNM
uniref:GP-PDE domain-containing protein n=1 Tax=Meleagris gallopavo TaxID=9103 RepID=G1N655_MELGA